MLQSWNLHYIRIKGIRILLRFRSFSFDVHLFVCSMHAWQFQTIYLVSSERKILNIVQGPYHQLLTQVLIFIALYQLELKQDKRQRDSIQAAAKSSGYKPRTKWQCSKTQVLKVFNMVIIYSFEEGSAMSATAGR